ncbi:MAG TPA: hypothetical protein VF720_08270 [Candidatus Eisenbacteria bacterium]
MTRFINTPTGLVRNITALSTLTVLSLLAIVTLVGCGTDVSTAPEFVNIESDDGGYQPGEVPLPSRKGAVEAPIGLTLQQISSTGALLTWNEPSTGLTALIDLNGVRIAEVDASNGNFTDNLAKSPGMYHYTVCFQNSVKRMSQMKGVDGEVKAVPDGSDRRDDRMEDAH